MAAKSEKDKVASILGDFQYENSRAWQLILTKLDRTLIQNELFHLGTLFKEVTGLSPGRNERRNKKLLIKFFDDNFDQFSAFMERIAFQDVNGNIGGPQADVIKSMI